MAAVRYVIDSKASTFTVRAFSEGLLSAFARSPRIAIRVFEGEAHFTPGGTTIQDGTVHVRIRADSLEVTDDVSEKDRREMHKKMYDEVLEIDRYPEILYECSRVSANGSNDGWYAVISLRGSKGEAMDGESGNQTLSGGCHMCLAIPGKIIEISADNPDSALVDVVSVRRRVDLGLLQDDRPKPGDWVLIHVGFAMSKISEQDAQDQMQTLRMLGESEAALQEVRGYGLEGDGAEQ